MNLKRARCLLAQFSKLFQTTAVIWGACKGTRRIFATNMKNTTKRAIYHKQFLEYFR